MKVGQELVKEKITSGQAIQLMIFVVLPTAVLFLPALTAKIAQQDSWLAPLISTLGGFFIALLVKGFTKYYPAQTLFQWGESIAGKYLGKIIGTAYVFWFVHTNAIILREFGSFMTNVFFPKTPMLAIIIPLTVLLIYALLLGIEVYARLAELFFPLFLLIVIGLHLLSIPFFDMTLLLPFLAEGWQPVIESSFTPFAWRGELILLAMLIPFLARPEKAATVVAWSSIILGIILTFSTIGILMVYGPNLTESMNYPFFFLARLVSIGEFIERFDAFIMLAWVPALFIKAGMFLFAASLGAAQVLNVKDYRPFVPATAVVMTALSILIFESDVEMTEFIVNVFTPVAFWFEYWIPAVLLLLGFIRRTLRV
ncbi:GerAB/ArcD/ProY family transporter [Heliorestis acidaminivorans]|uniref:GerAB/ArcD/ProY family transporter n=1 Tax=Heliorestis acidaminivorans TaxID=553427 RepID=A0A6I0EYU2_9FIRM|nr:endospore germination permease [Heliorestis acidaminivorans]KAB2951972.1 GerAB/ArcD/ProY family transporter [Heliorestis acidaminivorans]